jgi:hypothetical protein
VSFDKDGRSFIVEVRAAVAIPLVEDEEWVAEVRITATFVSDISITRRDAVAFARASGVFLVWPYARATLTDLARAAGVSAPMLPLLTRPASA